MEAKKLKSLSEWGVLDAAKASAKAAGSFAARNAGKILAKAPKIARTASIEGAKGVAVETGFEASKEYHEKKQIENERAKLHAERQALRARFRQHSNDDPEVNEALIHSTPPVVLILKRKSIRLFPQGEKIALYRNDKLGVNFAVPYDDNDLSTDTTIGAAITAEGFGAKIAKPIFTFLKKKKIIGQPLDADDIDALKRTPSIATDVNAQLRSVVGVAGGAVAGGIVANHIGKKLRKKIENPDLDKKIKGAPVYEGSTVPRSSVSYYKASARQFAKLGAIGGLAFGAGKTAWDVASDEIKKKKKKKMSEGRTLKTMFQFSEARRSVREGVVDKLAVGAATSLLASKGEANAIPITRKVTNFTAKTRAATQSGLKRVGIHGIGEERLDEFLPALAAGAVRVVGALAASRTGLIAARAIKNPVSRFIGGQAIIGAAAGGVEGAMKRKKQTVTPPPVTQKPTPPQDPEDNVSEGAMATRQQPARYKKFRVPRGLGREVAKGAAVALGTVAVQKLFDVGYDKWRDKKEVELAAKEARARTRANPLKKTITKRIVKPKSTVIVTKQFKEETAFEGLHRIVAEKQHGKVKHDNKTATEVDGFTAQAILNVHQHLEPENKAKLERLVNRDRAGLTKIADFAFRQHK